MSLRIACDLDGVLADLDTAITETAQRLFAPPPASEADSAQAPDSVLGLSRLGPEPATPGALENDPSAGASRGPALALAVSTVGGDDVNLGPAGPGPAGADSPAGNGRTQVVIDNELADLEAAISEAVRRPPAPLPQPEDFPAEAAAESDERAPGAGSAREDRIVEALPREAPGKGPAAEEAFVEGAFVERAAVEGPLAELLTDRQRAELWRELRRTTNFWETLAEAEPGAVGRLARLADERRWEILFITQRPSTAGATCQAQTHRWLEQHGFMRPSVFVIRGSRGKIASALGLDVVIDDRPENCLDVVTDSRARAMLIWRGEAGSPVVQNARRLGIEVFGSFFECLQALSKPPRPSLLGRLVQMLGGRKE